MASGIEPEARIPANRRRGTVFSAFGVARRIAIAGFHWIALSALPAGAITNTPQDDADDAVLVRAIKRNAHALTGATADYDRLLRKIGNSRIVLLGEDTHGTHEFYVERARITRRLIAEQDFAGVVIEGDWSEAAGLRAFLIEPDHHAGADAALEAFARFPRWMWRNSDFRDFIVWLRRFNLRRAPGAPPVVIRGMDLYEVASSAAAVIGYLDQASPESAARARNRYACLDAGGDEPPADGTGPARWPDIDCGQPVQDQLTELATGAFSPDSSMVDSEDEAYLHALQSARVVRNAEEYFRTQYRKPDESWNIRDYHMASSIDLLLAHLDTATGARSRLVIWAHNAHIGDARATARGDAGGVTIGQLLRERYPGDTVSVGFTTAAGIVRAATDWGGPDSRKRMRRPIRDSHAALMHATGLRRFYLILDEAPALRAALDQPRPQRGIGVRYLPQLELAGHYYYARLSGQFDALVHIDRTTPLRPPERERPQTGAAP